ncbi:MAG: PilZ domain-containing protein [Myxococcota bacterium]
MTSGIAARTEPVPSGQKERSRFDLCLEVPARLFGPLDGVVGCVRNVSEQGMLIECPVLPPLGSRVEVVLGLQGSCLALLGDVRHHVRWRHGDSERGLRGLTAFGLRFLHGPAGVAGSQELAGSELH